MATRWYVLCSKPRKERVLWRQLQEQGYEVFFPQIFRTGREAAKPYFPGYLFVRVDLDLVSQSTFQWMPFTSGLALIGDKPASVPDSLVGALRKRISRINSTEETGRTKTKELFEDPTHSIGMAFDACASAAERVEILFQLLAEPGS